MRYVIYGAGAIGSVVGGRLARAGEDVVMVARPAHATAIAADGLRIETPDGVDTVRVAVATHPRQLELGDGDVVLLAMKTQHTLDAVLTLRDLASRSVPVVSMQNGVANERTALRWFERVYGMCVMCPASYLEPGVVQAYAAPVTGVMDLGRYPGGIDDVATAVAEAMEAATFSSKPIADVMRWKHTKLLMNLGNALQAVGEPGAWMGPVWERAQAEGEACYRAAGIEWASREEDAERRGVLTRQRPIAGRDRGGGSTWQSLARGTGSIESDYLNGEIVLLGRRHGVPTPVNALLQQLANEAASRGDPPGAVSEAEFTRRLEDA
jgi:2-dehydropantoate 2-reductase